MVLARRFYRRDSSQVAPDLLGCFLVHRRRTGTTIGRIVETEAYGGEK